MRDERDYALFWYAIWAYNFLRDYTKEEIKALVLEIGDLTQAFPLQALPLRKWKLKFEKLADKELTSYQLLALLMVGMDILVDGDISKNHPDFQYLKLAKKVVEL